MADKPTYEQLEQRVKGLEKEALELRQTEEALRESARRLEVAYDQAIIYAQQLKEEIADRKRAEETLQKARDELEERVVERTAELSRTNVLSKRKIAELRQVEEALRDSEVRLKTVLDTIQAGIVVIDPATHIIVGVNAAARKMVGASGKQILGSVCHKYICPEEEGQCPVTDRGQNLDNSEEVLLTARGKRVPILKTVVPVILAGREHLLESLLDITERKRAEEALRESEKRMEILTFANDLALKLMHELRNPLAAIGGLSKLISSKHYPEEKLKEYTRIILEQSLRLENAVNEVLIHLKVGDGQV